MEVLTQREVGEDASQCVNHRLLVAPCLVQSLEYGQTPCVNQLSTVTRQLSTTHHTDTTAEKELPDIQGAPWKQRSSLVIEEFLDNPGAPWEPRICLTRGVSTWWPLLGSLPWSVPLEIRDSPSLSVSVETRNSPSLSVSVDTRDSPSWRFPVETRGSPYWGVPDETRDHPPWSFSVETAHLGVSW